MDSADEFLRIAYDVNTKTNEFEWGSEDRAAYLWDKKNGNTSYDGIRSKTFLDALESGFKNRPNAYFNDGFYQNNDFEPEMQALRVLSDVAVACCNNLACKKIALPNILPRAHEEEVRQ
jgi:hypothetical protein